jgi:hypothetical protein
VNACRITKLDRIVFNTNFEHAETRWTRIWREAHQGEFREAHMGSHDTYAVLRIETDTGHAGAWTGSSQVMAGLWRHACERTGIDLDSCLIGRSPDCGQMNFVDFECSLGS